MKTETFKMAGVVIESFNITAKHTSPLPETISWAEYAQMGKEVTVEMTIAPEQAAQMLRTLIDLGHLRLYINGVEITHV